ncbi:MAG: EamA family transporter [Candidatus Micrarchaeota archaeon]
MWFWYALGAAVIVALSAMTEKKILQHEHSLSFSTGYSLVVLLLSLPLFFFADFSTLTRETLVFLYIGTWLASIGFWLNAKGTKHLDLSIASPLTVSSLAFLPFLAFFLVGEKLVLQQIIGVALIFIGVVALELIIHHGKLFPVISTKGKERYISLMLLAGLLYALTAIVDKTVLSTWSVFTYLLIAHCFIAFNSVILMWVIDENYKRDLKKLFSQDWKIIVLDSILSVFARLLTMFAISGAYVSLVVAVKRLSALFTTVVGGKLFHEKNLKEKIAISIMMVAGAALLALS